MTDSSEVFCLKTLSSFPPDCRPHSQLPQRRRAAVPLGGERPQIMVRFRFFLSLIYLHICAIVRHHMFVFGPCLDDYKSK